MKHFIHLNDFSKQEIFHGISEIDDIEYIQRGYEDFEGKLSALGAVIARVDSERELQKFKLKIG